MPWIWNSNKPWSDCHMDIQYKKIIVLFTKGYQADGYIYTWQTLTASSTGQAVLVAVSIKIGRLTCINSRRSRDRLIFKMKIIIPRKPFLYWVSAPDPYGMLNAIIYKSLIGFIYMYLSFYTAQYPANSYKSAYTVTTRHVQVFDVADVGMRILLTITQTS